MPKDRWDLEELYHPDAAHPGTMWSRKAGLLEGIDRFDAAFFGITPKEAKQLDPQQRLLLECVWNALEDAGLPPDRISGSNTGVFVGCSGRDYERYATADRKKIDAYCGTGNSGATAAGRISYLLNLSGPSFSVDTACSSSLVALHLACQSLRQGECDSAIVAGVNVLFPEYSINFTKAHMLSPESICKTFDAAANGYVRAEGAGAILLQSVKAARAAGNPILAIVFILIFSMVRVGVRSRSFIRLSRTLNSFRSVLWGS